MKTKNNFNYTVNDGVIILQITRYESPFSKSVREAKQELMANENLPKEIIIKKTDFLKIEL